MRTTRNSLEDDTVRVLETRCPPSLGRDVHVVLFLFFLVSSFTHWVRDTAEGCVGGLLLLWSWPTWFAVSSVSKFVAKRHDSRVCLCLDISDFCLWPYVHPVTMSAIVEALKELMVTDCCWPRVLSASFLWRKWLHRCTAVSQGHIEDPRSVLRHFLGSKKQINMGLICQSFPISLMSTVDIWRLCVYVKMHNTCWALNTCTCRQY